MYYYVNLIIFFKTYEIIFKFSAPDCNIPWPVSRGRIRGRRRRNMKSKEEQEEQDKSTEREELYHARRISLFAFLKQLNDLAIALDDITIAILKRVHAVQNCCHSVFKSMDLRPTPLLSVLIVIIVISSEPME
eukprot:SAG31_NODE_845_length_11547_cov_8.098096_7_plen_133_part_00